MSYAKHTKPKAQSVYVKTDKDQVRNSSGAYVNQVDNWTMLSRFLVLGTEKPTYHAGTKNITKNIKSLDACLKEDGKRVVETLLFIDISNLAPHRDVLLFALAYALKKGDFNTRVAASKAAETIVRTGRDIATFTEELNTLGGWGRLTRKTVANWYLRDNVAYQVVKYRNTTGNFSHRNILRLSHPKAETEEQNNLFRYLVDNKDYDMRLLPEQIRIFESVKNAEDAKEVIAAVKAGKLTHEMIPTHFKKDASVWKALAENMPFRALVWNLGTFSELNMLGVHSEFETLVLNKLRDKKQIIGSRIHPLTLLVAMRNYAKGQGERKSWPVNNRVAAALEYAINILFENVEKSNVKIAAIVDTSGSMSSDYGRYGGQNVKNMLSGSGIKPVEAAGILAAIQARTSDAYILGVDSALHKPNITEHTSLADAVATLRAYRGGMTNLGLALQHLTDRKIKVDCIVYYTDNEVNAGYNIVALFDRYKTKVNPDARFIAVAFEANDFSIADAKRNDMLDVAGFDSNTVNVINTFAEGKF